MYIEITSKKEQSNNISCFGNKFMGNHGLREPTDLDLDKL